MSSKTTPAGFSPAQSRPLTRAASPANTPNLAQGQNTEDSPPTVFPPPKTFDVLPSIHALLVHLLSAPENTQQTSTGSISTPNAGQSGESLLSPTADITAINSLDPKELAKGASAVKILLQKAKKEVQEMPDIGRTVGEQEEEIVELEKRIQRLTEVIGDFGRRSGDLANGA